ncbi:MAG: hypothetical protein Q7S12_01150, partial [bacterium]|nr:hypothetical protein [bacterium]
MHEIFFDQEKYISVKKAASLTGYADDYIGQLCRLNKIKCRMVGHNWYVSESSILSYQKGISYVEEPDENKISEKRYALASVIILFFMVAGSWAINFKDTGFSLPDEYVDSFVTVFHTAPVAVLDASANLINSAGENLANLEIAIPQISIPQISFPEFALPHFADLVLALVSSHWPEITFPFSFADLADEYLGSFVTVFHTAPVAVLDASANLINSAGENLANLEIVVPQISLQASILSSIGNGILSVWNSVVDFVAGLFSFPAIIVQIPVNQTPTPTPTPTPSPRIIISPITTSSGGVTIIDNTKTIIQRQVLGSEVTISILDTKLSELYNKITTEVYARLSQAPSPVIIFSGPAANTPISTQAFAPSQRIDNLSSVTITNATVNGVTGLTDADIPDGVTASNYLPLSGGTIGTLTVSGATSTFANGIALTAGCFQMPDGTCVGGGSGSGTVTSGTINQLAYYTGAATVSSSGFLAVNNSSGFLGVATNTPSQSLSVQGNGLFSGNLSIANLIATGTTKFNDRTYTWPSSIVAGNFLQTDGSGNLAWATASSGGGSDANFTFIATDGGYLRLATTTNAVGIGTTTPYAKLSVESVSTATTTFALRPFTGQTANILDVYDTSGNLTTVINSSNNFGLGTSSPSQSLSVQGNGLFAGNLSIANLIATGTIQTSGTATSTWANSGLSVAGGGLASSAGLTITGGSLLNTSTATSTFSGGISSAGLASSAGLTITGG